LTIICGYSACAGLTAQRVHLLGAARDIPYRVEREVVFLKCHRLN
jgi:hypothetical protein